MIRKELYSGFKQVSLRGFLAVENFMLFSGPRVIYFKGRVLFCRVDAFTDPFKRRTASTKFMMMTPPQPSCCSLIHGPFSFTADDHIIGPGGGSGPDGQICLAIDRIMKHLQLPTEIPWPQFRHSEYGFYWSAKNIREEIQCIEMCYSWRGIFSFDFVQ